MTIDERDLLYTETRTSNGYPVKVHVTHRQTGLTGEAASPSVLTARQSAVQQIRDQILRG